MRAVVSLNTLGELRAFVRRTLCEQDHIDPEQATFRQALITRSGRTCGMFFQVEGPRLLKTSAVWSSQEGRIIFYDSTGARRGHVELCESPTLDAPYDLPPA